MNQSTKNAFVQLHIAVFIFGFTAILGKLISQDHFTIVWQRMWLAALGFLFFPRFITTLKQTSKKHFIYLLLIGCLVAIHWITFYGSIKIGKSASLTLGCFGLTSTFTSILEPIIYKKKFVLLELLLGILALIGISIIAYFSPQTGENGGQYTLAIIVGVFSAFVAALFSTINSTFTNKIDTKVMTFSELLGGFLMLTIFLILQIDIPYILPVNEFKIIPTTDVPMFINSKYADLIWIAILALVCTNIAFVMNLNAMKKVSAFTANLAINLEPVYGIILAAFILKEHQFLNLYFYIGTSIILSSVLIHSIIKSRGKKH